MDGKIVKMEKDYSSQVDSLLPTTESLAKGGGLGQAIDQLLTIEKQSRVAADLASNTRILLHIIHLTFTYGDESFNLVTDHIMLLSKRHGALKQAVTKMVQEAMSLLPRVAGTAQKMKLIETLRQVTDGKIYVEVERARLTKSLAEIQEASGDIEKACDTMQELQVETFGSMQVKEKTQFILDQMRLTLMKKDYTRTQLNSKKINTKHFEKHKGMTKLKLRYYLIMVEWGMKENEFKKVAQFWHELYDTLRPRYEDEVPKRPEDSEIATKKGKTDKQGKESEDQDKMDEEDPDDIIENKEEKWRFCLLMLVAFLCLTPFDNERSDMLHRVYNDPNLQKLPMAKMIAKLFVSPEIMRFQKLEEVYGDQLKSMIVFFDGTKGLPCGAIPFEQSTIQVNPDEGKKRWLELHKRVIEHNIRVISKYYTRITLKRLTELLDLPPHEAESYLSSLVVSGTIFARIDRPAGIISFEKSKDPETVLNEWSGNLKKLLNLVEKTTHLITKEEMVHRIQRRGSTAAT